MNRVFAEPWRMRCPHGHASLSAHGLATQNNVYCNTCNQSYSVDNLLDAKTDVLP